MSNSIRIFYIGIILLALGCKSTKIDQKRVVVGEGNDAILKDQDTKPSDTKKRAFYKSVNFEKNSRQFQFLDTITGVVKSAFNIDDNNPYMKEYGKYSDKEHKNYFYFTERDSLKKFLSSEQLSIYERQEPNTCVDRAYSIEYYYNNDNYALAAYNLYLVGSDATIGCQSNLLAFDKNGNKIFHLDNLYVNVGSAVITNDGQHACMTYGGGDEYGTFLLNGYRIYNTQTKKLIIEEKYPKEFLNSFFMEINFDLLFIRMGIVGEVSTEYFVVYDFNKAERYKYVFKQGTYKTLVEINKLGVIYKNLDGINDTAYYRKNFTTEKISVQ